MLQLFALFQLESEMLLLTLEAILCALKNVHLELHLSVLFLRVLHLVSIQVKRVLDLLSLNVILFQLAALDGKFTLGRVEFFLLLRNFSFILGLLRLEACHLISSVLQALVEHLDRLVGFVDVLQYTIVTSFKVTMCRVHVVQFGFEFESELDFLLVILSILSVVLFQLQTHLLLVHHLSLKLLTHFLLCIKVLLQDLLVVSLLL